MRPNLKPETEQSEPSPVLPRPATWLSKWSLRRFRSARMLKVFTRIHSRNRWGSSESVSGPGSEVAATHIIREALPRLIKQHGITSLLDAPCGDFNWMQAVDLAGVSYIGGDVVQELIESVSRRYAAPNRRFVHLDLVNDPLPAVDLIFCRDCFLHLPDKLIHRALANFRRCGARFVMLSTFADTRINNDTHVGGFHAVNLCAAPFNLPPPMELIPEQQPAEPGAFYKCMGLWSTRVL